MIWDVPLLVRHLGLLLLEFRELLLHEDVVGATLLLAASTGGSGGRRLGWGRGAVRG